MSIAALALIDPKLAESNDISQLAAQFRHYPLLNRDEETRLATAYYQDQDHLAAQQLILANMRYVIRIAKGYLGYGLPAKDLVQEGCIGLMKSIKSFNPHQGVRLLTYAVYWIKAEMQEYIIRNWRLVKIASTKAQRKLFFNLRSLKQKIHWLSHEQAQATAQQLDVPVAEVRHMESRFAQSEQSLDDEEHMALDHLPALADHSTRPEGMVLAAEQASLWQQSLTTALAALTPRERDIITSRWLTPTKASLKDLAERFGISLERVRQLEQKAMQRMRPFFSARQEVSHWLEQQP